MINKYCKKLSLTSGDLSYADSIKSLVNLNQMTTWKVYVYPCKENKKSTISTE